MVMNNQEAGEVDLEQRLLTAWQAMLGQQQSAAAFIEESQKKDMGGDHGQVAFFNNKLVSSSLIFSDCFLEGLGHQPLFH